MTNDGSQKDAASPPDPRPAAAAGGPPPAPVAWLPLTPRGVAAFATATFGRLFIVQLIVALLAAAALVRFIHSSWCPVLREAIRQLPDQGIIRDGQLQLPDFSIVPARDSRFLAVTFDRENQNQPKPLSDVQVRFGRERVQICGGLGCLTIAYPKPWIIDFNRTALEPWWGAWEPVLLAGVAVLTMVSLLLLWALLATAYFIPARLAALYTERKITLTGSWRLAGAALMPGALLLSAALLLYGAGVLDGLGLAIMGALHLLAGWIYLFLSPLFLLKSPYTPRGPRNPFRPPPTEPGP